MFDGFLLFFMWDYFGSSKIENTDGKIFCNLNNKIWNMIKFFLKVYSNINNVDVNA